MDAPSTPFRFSKEEIRVLRECNRESFYKRCLPLSTTLGMGTYMAVKSGYLQPNARYGATPKVLAAIVIGFIAGKISYQKICAEKLMALPSSKIAATLRTRGLGPRESVTLEGPSEFENLFNEAPDSQKYSDLPKNTGMDLDTDRPLSSGFDEEFKPSIDGLYLDDDSTSLLPPPNPAGTTYEDLRRRNREEYEQKRTKPYRGVVTPEDVPTGLRPSLDGLESPRDYNFPKSYSDIWEK